MGGLCQFVKLDAIRLIVIWIFFHQTFQPSHPIVSWLPYWYSRLRNGLDTCVDTRTSANFAIAPVEAFRADRGRLVPYLRHGLFNPFTASACKFFRAENCTNTPANGKYFDSVTNLIRCMFWWKSFHILRRRRQRKSLRISNFALLLVVFKWHYGGEKVKGCVAPLSSVVGPVAVTIVHRTPGYVSGIIPGSLSPQCGPVVIFINTMTTEMVDMSLNTHCPLF